MPNHKSNWKRLRQDKVRRLRSRINKSRIRTHIKKVLEEAANNTITGDALEKSAREIFRLVDRAARRKVIHPRNAARKKSRIARLLNRARASQSA